MSKGYQEQKPTERIKLAPKRITMRRLDILGIRHWQLIPLLFAMVIPLEIALTYLIYFWPALWWIDGQAAMLLYIAYPVLTSKRLSDLLSGEPLFERTDSRKLIAAAIATITLMTCMPLIANHSPEALHAGISAILLVMLSFICAVPGKQLKSIEMKRNAGIWEYVPDAFLFLLWPLGVLWLQPRINRILERKIIIKE